MQHIGRGGHQLSSFMTLGHKSPIEPKSIISTYVRNRLIDQGVEGTDLIDKYD